MNFEDMKEATPFVATSTPCRHLHTVLQAANTSSSPCIREEGELNRSANGEEDGAVDANVGVLVNGASVLSSSLSIDEDEDGWW